MVEQSSPSVDRIVPTIEKLFDGQIVLLLLIILLAANVLAARLAGASVLTVEWSTLSSKPGLMLALIVMVGMFTAWVVPAACAIALQLVGAILFSDVTPKWIITPLLAREGRDIVSEWRRGYVYAHEVKKRAIRDKDAFSMRRHEAYEAAAVSERKEQWRFVHRVFACCVLLTLDIGSGVHSLFRSMAPLLSQIVTIEHPIGAHISAMIILWLFWFWLSFMPESRELMEHPELAEERLKRLQAERDHSDELVSRVRRGRAEIERACAEG